MTHPDEQAANPLRRRRCGAEPHWCYSFEGCDWHKAVAVACWECGLLGRPWHPANAFGHKKAAEQWAERVSEA